MYQNIMSQRYSQATRQQVIIVAIVLILLASIVLSAIYFSGLPGLVAAIRNGMDIAVSPNPIPPPLL